MDQQNEPVSDIDKTELHHLVATFENAAIGMAHVAPDGTFVRANQKLCETVGYNAKELCGKTFMQITHPDDLEADMELARRLERGEIPHYTLDKRYLHKNGSPVWVRITCSTCRHADGTMDVFIVAIRDIDSERKATDALRRSESLFRRMADANLVGVGFGDSHGNVTYMNDEMLRMMGYTREDYEAGRINLSSCIAPEYRKDVEESGRRLLEEGVLSGYERAFLRPDGGRTPYMGAAALMEPGLDLHVSFAIDLTRQKEAEEKHEKAVAEAAAAKASLDSVNAMGEGVALLDLQGGICNANPAFANLAGTDAQTLKGRNIRTILPGLFPSPEEQPELQLITEPPGEPPAFALDVQGKRHWLVPALVDITGSGGEAVYRLLTLKDLTDLVEAQEEARANEHSYRTHLRELADWLVDKEEKDRRRLSIQLHDTVIQSLSLGNIRLGALRNALGQAERTAELEQVERVRELLSDGIAECRSLMDDLTPHLLHTMGLVAALRDFAEKQSQRHSQPITFHGNAAAEPTDDLLKGMLFHAARELVMNALKYAEANEIRIRHGTGRSWCWLEVCDDGCGFDPDASGLFSVRSDGGFGLFNIRERLRSVGGQLHLDTAPGCGTTVRILLPLSR